MYIIANHAYKEMKIDQKLPDLYRTYRKHARKTARRWTSVLDGRAGQVYKNLKKELWILYATGTKPEKSVSG